MIPTVSFVLSGTTRHGGALLVDRALVVTLYAIGAEGISDNALSITLVAQGSGQLCFGVTTRLRRWNTSACMTKFMDHK